MKDSIWGLVSLLLLAYYLFFGGDSIDAVKSMIFFGVLHIVSEIRSNSNSLTVKVTSSGDKDKKEKDETDK